MEGINTSDIDKLYKELHISNTDRNIRNSIHLGRLNNKLNSNFSIFKNKEDVASWTNTATIKEKN